MFKSPFRALIISTILILAGCTTSGHFVLPEGSTLYLGDRPQPVKVEANGTVTTHPFGWKAIGIPPNKGIPYRLEKDGKTIQQGKLRSVFRGASLFAPPIVGVFAVPVGLNPNITYNLVTGKQE